MPPPGHSHGFQLESFHCSLVAPTSSQELPFILQPSGTNYSSVDITTTPPTSGRADPLCTMPLSQLDHTTIARLSRHLFTNNAEINSALGDVNAEHQSETKRGRMPNPANLTGLLPHHLYSTNPFVLTTPSSLC